MDEDVVEGDFFHEFAGHEHHAGNPEEDDIIACDHDARREELLDIFRFFRPAHSRERPESRAEPCIEDIGVAMDMFAVAVLAFGDIFTADGNFAAVVAVPGRNLMAPPELAADAPVMDIFHPVIICLAEPFGDKPGFPSVDGINSCFGQRSHLDEPLFRRKRFNDSLAAGAVADRVGQRFDVVEEAQFFQVGNDGFAAFFPCHAIVFGSGPGIHRTIQIHDHD